VVNGSDSGAPANPAVANDTAVAFAPDSGGTSLLEGAVLVPTSAYIAAAFSSSCDAAQRACIGLGATPELDFNASEDDHLGWDAAVSSVSAFSLFLGPSAVLDTPDGLPFWPAGSGVTPLDLSVGPSVPVGTPTVTGSPIPVPIAVSIQHAFYPTPNPNGSSGPPNRTVPISPRSPTSGGGREGGGAAPSAPPLPTGASGTPGIPLLDLLGGIIVLAGIGLSTSALAARRRRPPRRRENEPLDPSVDAPAEGGEPSEDPMGYVW